MCAMCYTCRMENERKVSERRVALTMSAEELDDLDAYCAALRRATGENTERAAVIRKAVALLIHPPELNPEDVRKAWVASLNKQP